MEIRNPYVETYVVYETKALVSELCKQFYGLGWVLGTGGSVSIKVHDDKLSKSDQLIVMSPSGVQKERMVPEDMYVLSSNGVVLSTPVSKPYPYKYPKCSECTPLFLQAYKIRNAGAVIHSHGIESCLVTMIHPLMKEFRIRNMEMIKGIEGHGYHDELVIPIIENTAKEGDLIDSFTEAIRSYPKSTAVLVRNHGVYIWGETWISAKTQAECYHYLFVAAVKLHQMGLDWSTLNHDSICNANTVRGSSGNIQSTTVETRFNCSIDPQVRRLNRQSHPRKQANAYAETSGVYETKTLVSELCKQFYGLGWVSGTGGSVSIKVFYDKKFKSDQLIVMSTSGVQKERMMPEDVYVLSSDGVVLSTPSSKPYPYNYPKCSECTPLFFSGLYDMQCRSRDSQSWDRIMSCKNAPPSDEEFSSNLLDPV